MAQDRAKAPVRVEAAGRTDVGRRRDHNEDNLLLQQELQLFIVADGMGGHNAGEVASALATTSLENFFAATDVDDIPEDFAGDQSDNDLKASAKRLTAAVRKANADVYEIASKMKQHSGMGSTVVVAHVSYEEQLIHICHVGDSRCYRIRDGQIEQLTRDHSLINDALAMRPDLTEDILAELPANVITRAVGTQASVQVDIRSEEIREEDLYLLCSDGLSGLVSEEQIVEVCSLTDDLDEMCELLIIMANEAGGNDNITAVAFRIESPDTERPSVEERTEEVAIAVGETPEPVTLEADAEPVGEAADPADQAEAIVPAEPTADEEQDEGEEAPAAVDEDEEPEPAAEEESSSVDVVAVVELDEDAADEEAAAAASIETDEQDLTEPEPPIEVAPVVEMAAGRSYPPPPGEEADVGVAALEVEAGALVEDIDIEAAAAELEVVEESEPLLAASGGAEAVVAVCTGCGHEVFEGGLFCVECGTRISAASTATVPLSELQASDDAHIDIDETAESDEAMSLADDETDEDFAIADDDTYDDTYSDEDEYEDDDEHEDDEYEDDEYEDDDGESLEEDEPPAFCHECGARLIEGTRFCVQCGVRV